ncbi:hypothetical protein Tco_0668831 [Tanacetum coccineum]
MHGLSMKDWRGRRAVSFNINSSGASLYKGKGQTLSQVGFAMTINKSQGQTLPQCLSNNAVRLLDLLREEAPANLFDHTGFCIVPGNVE